MDWTLYVVGPYGAALLAWLGADVIHVEQPPLGDPQQMIGPMLNGLSALYIYSNLGKRSIHLDMNDAVDRDRMWKCIETSDVLLTNWRQGVPEKFGFDRAAVLERNPEIIYLPGTGFGEFGPMKDIGGTDPVLQAFGGWCSIMGQAGGRWEFMRYASTIDANSGLYLATAVLTALMARGKVGGHIVELSMLESVLAMQSNRLSEHLAGGQTPEPLGSAYSVVAPSQAFRCLDQAYLAVSAETEGQWQRLCEAIGKPELAGDPRFLRNRDRVQRLAELAEVLQAVFSTKPAGWWSTALNRARVPNSRFWSWDLMRVHPQMLENEYLVQVDTGASGVVPSGGPPWKFAEVPAVVRPNPYSGEHTEEILREIAAIETAPPARRPTSSGPPELPFSGLRVLDLSAGLSGPYCGAMLADQGAAVVKVEIGAGDHLRDWGPPFVDGVGTAYRELNRNKEIRHLEAGAGDLRERLLDLAAEVDVVIADFVDGDGQASPLQSRDARARNPRLIWCSVSHYGETGPLSGLPGSELTVQAMSDCAGGLGRIGEEPLRIGADQASMSAGIFAYQGIVAALLRRERDGIGERVAVSCLGAIMSVKGNHWPGLSEPDDWPAAHLTIWTDPPSYGYRTADLPITFVVNRRLRKATDPERVRGLIERLGGTVPAEMNLAPSTARTAAGPVDARWASFWEALFAPFGWRELAAIFAEFGGDAWPILSYPELSRHPQVAALQTFVALEGDPSERRVVRVPWRLSPYPQGFRYRAAKVRHDPFRPTA